jgi:hypothetical protein
MARTTIRSTYALDVGTVRTLEAVARRWRVSKSEALRRAIRAAAGTNSLPVSSPLAALDRLQSSIARKRIDVEAWAGRLRRERRASSLRRERRSG